jgi:hypothetical protein
VLADQVDQHAEERQHDHEHHPRRLAPAADVVAAEQVSEHRDDDPEPDHPAEEDDDRPEDVQERVVGSNQHLVIVLSVVGSWAVVYRGEWMARITLWLTRGRVRSWPRATHDAAELLDRALSGGR